MPSLPDPLIDRAEINMARRRFQPAGYAPVFGVVSAEIEDPVWSFKGRTRHQIYDGSIALGTLSSAQEWLLEALGLIHVRPKADLVRARRWRELRERHRRR